jgi:LPS-assembly lipoprotein
MPPQPPAAGADLRVPPLAPTGSLPQTSPMNTPRIALAVLFAAALSACGFQLRNVAKLPADLGPVAVVAPDPYSPLADAIARALERGGAQPAATDAIDQATKLEILSEKWADLPIAVDTQGRAQEYSLRYAVVFRLRKPDGEVLVPQQAVELARDYVAPASDAIGNTSERDLLLNEMRRDMTAAILRRVNAALQVTTPAAGS